MNEFVCLFFAMKSEKGRTETDSLVHFFGESTDRQSVYGFI